MYTYTFTFVIGNNNGENFPKEFLVHIYERMQKVKLSVVVFFSVGEFVFCVLRSHSDRVQIMLVK